MASGQGAELGLGGERMDLQARTGESAGVDDGGTGLRHWWLWRRLGRGVPPPQRRRKTAQWAGEIGNEVLGSAITGRR
jgi:hypothetical protein